MRGSRAGPEPAGGQPKFEILGHRDVNRERSSINLEEGASVRLFIYKIRRADIEGLGYTMEDVATVIDNPSLPRQGTDRWIKRDFPIWYNTADSDSTEQGVVDGARAWRTSEADDGVRKLTDGYLMPDTVLVGGDGPTASRSSSRTKSPE